MEYVACEPHKVKEALESFWTTVRELLAAEVGTNEAFFYAVQIHLVFVKIHPLQDGNGRIIGKMVWNTIS